VALTRNERKLIAAYLPTARERVRVVGNEDDCPAARDAARRRDQNDTPMALCTGRFMERNIAAIPSVLAREPGTRFVLAGGHRLCSGEDMARYWLPPGFEPYRDCVHFTGWLSPDALARSAIGSPYSIPSIIISASCARAATLAARGHGSSARLPTAAARGFTLRRAYLHSPAGLRSAGLRVRAGKRR
jgi:hypothetical protein